MKKILESKIPNESAFLGAYYLVLNKLNHEH